jgi:hypothetical protein
MGIFPTDQALTSEGCLKYTVAKTHVNHEVFTK